MVTRQITEREFINYAKGLGNYCTYSDAKNALEAIFKALKHIWPESSGPFRELLPDSIKPVWDQVPLSEKSSGSIVNMIQVYGAFNEERDAKRALLTLFGTIKEKQRSIVEQWNYVIPSEIEWYWEKSRTIDEVQDALQCL